jgi:hypothetical protein
MIVTALVFSACQIVVCVCFALLVRSWAERKEQKLRSEITELVRGLIEAPDDKTPSPLAVLIDQGATLLASRLMQQLKAMLAGVESGLSKNEQLSFLEEASHGSPLLSALAGMLPKRIRSGLLKNPQMIGALSKMVSGNHNSGNSSGDDLGKL